jgi:hypothetical protein
MFPLHAGAMRRLPAAAARAAAVLALLAAAAGQSRAQDAAADAAPAEARERLGNEALRLMIDDAGDGQAEALLGVLYLRGVRIDPDPVAALAWFERAAESGHGAGVYAAARILAGGAGVAPDPDAARALLGDRDPALFGELADAVRALRTSLGLPPDPPRREPEPAGPAAPAEAAPPPADPPAAVALPAPAPPEPEPAAAQASTPPAPAPTADPVPPARAPEAPAVAAAPAAPPPAPAPPAAPEPPPEPQALTVGSGPDAQALRELADRIRRERAALVRGAELRVLPRFDGGTIAFELVADGVRDAAAAARLCRELGRSPAECAVRASPRPASGAPEATAQEAGAYVQLATVFDLEAAERERARFGRLVPEDLRAGAAVGWRSATLADGRAAFTIVLSPFADAAAARAACERLRRERIDCVPRG